MAELGKVAEATENYALRSKTLNRPLDLPELAYRPPRAKNYQPTIGLIGCGGITSEHLQAYRQAGYHVAAFADPDLTKAARRRDEYAPQADVYTSSDDLLGRQDIDIVDIATHPEVREQLIEDALLAGKHVLSQKPFVTDLERGRRLCQLADERDCRLAVNQNGRWAPWVSWMRAAIENQLIGNVSSVDTIISWDHSWVKGTSFEQIPHLILYDFAIHWFDMLHGYTRGQRASEVYASVLKLPSQEVGPPLMAQVSVQFEHCQASLSFRGSSPWGSINQTHITGTHGTLTSQGPGLDEQTVTLHTAEGTASPVLEGSWFPGGFDGAMSELVVAVEQQREPVNCGRENLSVLEIAFAAMQSAELGVPVTVGDVQKVKAEWISTEAVPCPISS